MVLVYPVAFWQKQNNSNIDPLTVPGLILWLDADDSSTTANLASTGTWLEKSGNNNHPTQVTPLLRPSVVTNALNGKSVVRFNEDYLQVNAFPGVKNRSSLYLLWIRKYNVLSKYQAVVSYGASPNFTNDLLFGVLDNNTQFFQINNGSDGSVNSGEAVNTNYIIESFEFDGSQSTNEARLKRFNQATQDTSLNYLYTVPTTTTNVDGALYIGTYFGGFSTWALNGDIAELFIFNQLPSLGNRNALVSMLVNKWFTV